MQTGSRSDQRARRLGASHCPATPTGSALREIGPWCSDGKTPALPLDAFFALNPAMPNLHRMYKAQQASSCTPRRRISRALAFRWSGRSRRADRPAAAVEPLAHRALVRAGIGRSGGSARAPRPWRWLGNPLVVRGKAPSVVARSNAPASDGHAGPLAGFVSAHRSETCSRA